LPYDVTSVSSVRRCGLALERRTLEWLAYQQGAARVPGLNDKLAARRGVPVRPVAGGRRDLRPCSPALDLHDYQGMNEVIAYLAAGLVALWGVAHAIPTVQVVAGFEPITADNRRVLTQEWLAEAFTMWGIAAVIVVATAFGKPESDVSVWVYRAAAGLLAALAVLTALTGARTPVVWFKVCPILLGSTAALLLLASFI
jgi:hypothetical protein